MRKRIDGNVKNQRDENDKSQTQRELKSKLQEGEERVSKITDLMIFLPLLLLIIITITLLNIPMQTEEYSSQTIATLNLSSEEHTKNFETISNIKEKYGITVMYGVNAASFAKGADGVEQYNEEIVSQNLTILQKALLKYPDSLFDMSRNGEHPISIILLESFNNNNIALASRNNLEEYKIFISNTNRFENSFHHEMYHVLEYYMQTKNKRLYPYWSNLNPQGFEYSSESTDTFDYVFDQTKHNSNIQQSINVENGIAPNDYYFISRYSKASEKEDRAEIFSNLMTLTYTPIYLSDGQKIKRKIDYIVMTIKRNITTQSFYFDKYV